MSPTNTTAPCPAWNQQPCPVRCYLRHACETDPAKTKALVEALDEQTITALHELNQSFA